MPAGGGAAEREQPRPSPAPAVPPRSAGSTPVRHRRSRPSAVSSSTCARRARGGRACRDGKPRRRLLDQPGGLDQPGRHLDRGAGRLVRRRHRHAGALAGDQHGQHIELGIAEGNLVGLLGELGLTWSRDGQALFPIGTLYDPFVARALEPWSFGIYAGGQSILVGHAFGGDARARGRGTPVDHHSFNRSRAAAVHRLGASLRSGPRMDTARSARPARTARWVFVLFPAEHPSHQQELLALPEDPDGLENAGGRRSPADICCGGRRVARPHPRRDGRNGSRDARGSRRAGGGRSSRRRMPGLGRPGLSRSARTRRPGRGCRRCAGGVVPGGYATDPVGVLENANPHTLSFLLGDPLHADRLPVSG